MARVQNEWPGGCARTRLWQTVLFTTLGQRQVYTEVVTSSAFPNGVLYLRGLAEPQQGLLNTWGAVAFDTLRVATAPREMTTSQTKSMKSNEILLEIHTKTHEILKSPAFLKE